jgi:hypothetical protein
MPTIHFNLEDLKPLIDHARAAPEHVAGYSDTGKPAPGLWLVGDQGIYLMSNGKPHLQKPGAAPDHSLIVYAKECNPDKDPDGWWDAKQSLYGGDDGVDTIPLAIIDELMADAAKHGVTPKTFGVVLTSRSMKFTLE